MLNSPMCSVTWAAVASEMTQHIGPFCRENVVETKTVSKWWQALTQDCACAVLSGGDEPRRVDVEHARLWSAGTDFT